MSLATGNSLETGKLTGNWSWKITGNSIMLGAEITEKNRNIFGFPFIWVCHFTAKICFLAKKIMYMVISFLCPTLGQRGGSFGRFGTLPINRQNGGKTGWIYGEREVYTQGR